MTENNQSENDSAEIQMLYHIPSTNDLSLHAKRNCQALTQTEQDPVLTTPDDAPRAPLCGHCAGDLELSDLTSDDRLPTQCPSCGHASSTRGSSFWNRTPQGRPSCPKCGVIPEGHELRRHKLEAQS